MSNHDINLCSFCQANKERFSLMKLDLNDLDNPREPSILQELDLIHKHLYEIHGEIVVQNILENEIPL